MADLSRKVLAHLVAGARTHRTPARPHTVDFEIADKMITVFNHEVELYQNEMYDGSSMDPECGH